MKEKSQRIVDLAHGVIVLADGSWFAQSTGRTLTAGTIVQWGPGYVDEWTPLRLLKPGLATW